MKKLLSLHIAAIIALTAVLSGFITGCSSSTTPPAGFTYTNPKAGTAYRYHVTMKDSTFGSPGTTSKGDSTSLVLTSGVSRYGKDSVIVLLNDSGQVSSDTTYYRFESNGDVTVYQPGYGFVIAGSPVVIYPPVAWLRIPIGSQKTGVTLFTMDTTVMLGTTAVPLHIVATADGKGNEELAPLGPRLAYGGIASVTITVTTSLITTPAVAVTTYSVDPSLGGYFHSTTTLSVPTILIYKGRNSSKDKILYSYTLVK
jgi:hypothetical protein